MDTEKKKLITFRQILKIFAIVFGGFIGFIALTIGVMYFAGSFEKKHVLPEAIEFNLQENDMVMDNNGKLYYSPNVITKEARKDDDGNVVTDSDGNIVYDFIVAERFSLNASATNEDVTDIEIDVSVSNEDVIKAVSSKASLGKDIEFVVVKNADGFVNGGYSEITIRSNGGLNGTQKINVFIDVPVEYLTLTVGNANSGSNLVKSSKSATGMYVDEIMTFNKPTFYPVRSENPSLVNEGVSTIAKGNKQYEYRVSFYLESENRYVDIDSSETLNTEQNRVVYWTDSTRTKLQAKKAGTFKVEAFAFKTYDEQERAVTSEESELSRMYAKSEEIIFTVTNVDYESLTGNNNTVSLTYKENSIKLYLRTSKTGDDIINLGMQINPNSNFGRDASDLYDKLGNVFISTDLPDQDLILRLTGIPGVDMQDNPVLYPIADEDTTYSTIEYYYLVDVIGMKKSDFHLVFGCENPNDGRVLTYSVATQIVEVDTAVFGFVKPESFEGVGEYKSLEMSKDGDKVVMNVAINPTDSSYVDLTKGFVQNKASGNKEPTYNKIRYYVYGGTSKEAASSNSKIFSTLDIITNLQPVEFSSGKYGFEIQESNFGVESLGLLRLKNYGTATICAILIKTDLSGNEVLNVDGTYAYRECEMTVNVIVDLEEVDLKIVDTEFTDLGDSDNTLKEFGIYYVLITPLMNGLQTENDIIDRYKDNLIVEFSTTQVIVDGIISFDSDNGYYLPIFVPNLNGEAGQEFTMACFKTLKDGEKVRLTPESEFVETYSIMPTSVTSFELTGNEYYSYEASWGLSGNIIWTNTATGLVESNGRFEVRGRFNETAENKTMEAVSSDRDAVKVDVKNDRATIELLKPTEEMVTITFTAKGNPLLSRIIQIKLTSADVIFSVDEASRLLDTELTVGSYGDVLENGASFAETVYKGDTIDMRQRVTASCNGVTATGLLYFNLSDESVYKYVGFEITDDMTRDEKAQVEARRNTFEETGVLTFVKNVDKSVNITVRVISKFGQELKYRFMLKNYVKIEYAGRIYNETIHENINDDYDSSNQNRMVVSAYRENEKEEYSYYYTFVWSQTSIVPFENLLYIEKYTNANINLLYSISRTNSGNAYVKVQNVNGKVCLVANGLNAISLRKPIVAYVSISEEDEEGPVFVREFPVLVVPNLKVRSETIESELETRTIYYPSEYIFTKELPEYYDFIDDDGNIGNLKIDVSELFSVSDFAGNVMQNARTDYELISDVANKGITIEKNASTGKTLIIAEIDKVYSMSTIKLKQTLLYNNQEYSATTDINIKPFYEIFVEEGQNILLDGTKDTIVIYTGRNIKLSDILSVMGNSSLEERFTYYVVGGSSRYITVRDATTSNATLIGSEYSGDNLVSISVLCDNVETGFILKVKVVNDLNLQTYGIAYEYTDGGEYYTENNPMYIASTDKIPLSSIFIAEKLSSNSLVSMSYTISNPDMAYIDTANQICFNASARQTLIQVTASTGLVGVEDLVMYFSIKPSQTMQIVYKYSENDILTLSTDLYSADELGVGWRGYMELQAWDTITLNDYIFAVNTINEVETNIFNQLTFVVETYTSTGEWQASKLYEPYKQADGKVYVTIKNNFSEPTYSRIKVTSVGGLLGYFNILLSTSSSVSSKDNVKITLTYPDNSSNYYADNLSYECVQQGTEVDLTAFENSRRRIYAEFAQFDVTDTLAFRFEAYDINTKEAYTGDDITIDGSVISIGVNVETGTVIKVYMHSSYTEFDEAYNMYVGGDAVIKFMNRLVEKNGERYNSTITFDANNSTNNLIAISDLFVITRLDGSLYNLSTELESTEKVEIKLENNFNRINGKDYSFANLVYTEQTPTTVAIDNFARQGGQIVSIIITVTDRNNVKTKATYLLKVAPSVLSLTNADGTANSASNPQAVLCSQSEASEFILVLTNENIDHISLSTIFANATNASLFQRDDIWLDVESAGGYLQDNSESYKLAFIPVQDTYTSKVVCVNICTTFGRVIPYYVELLPKYRIENNDIKAISGYSTQDIDLFDKTSDEALNLQAFNNGAYESINYSEDLVVVEFYADDELIDTSETDAYVKISVDGIISLGTVTTNKVITIKAYLKDDAGKEESLVELQLVILPNFNSADIVMNVNGVENSINNPIHLTDNGFYLTDVIDITRSIADGNDSSISTIRYPNGVSDVVKTFTFNSDLLTIEDYLVTIDDKYTSSVDKIATLELFMRDSDTVYKTFFVLIDANFSFIPVKDLTICYEDSPLDLTYMSDYFIGTNGEKIVGGQMKFSTVEEDTSALFTLENNVLTVASGLKKETKVKLVASYTVDTLTYVGAIDVLLEPKYSVVAKTNTINLVNTFSYIPTAFTVNDDVYSKDDFADLYFTISKGESLVHFNTSYASISVTGISDSGVYEVKLTVGDEVAYTYFKVLDTENAYVYSNYESGNLLFGGDEISLYSVVGEFSFVESGEVIEPLARTSYTFISLENDVALGLEVGKVIDDAILTSSFSVNERVYKVLVLMESKLGYTCMGVAKILFYPSVVINQTFTNPSQEISIFKAGETINLKDYISFAPQRATVADEVRNADARYEVFLFASTGERITTNLDNFYILSGSETTSEVKYSNLNPTLELTALADNHIIIIKSTMTFANGEEIYAYYYIKVDGLYYTFTQKSNLKTYARGDMLQLADIGSFSVEDVSDVSFSAIGSYYALSENFINRAYNLYDVVVEVLISAKYDNGEIVRDLFAVGQFILETSFEIDNYKDDEDKYVSTFDVLTSISKVNLLSTNYISEKSAQAFDLLEKVTIVTFDNKNRQVLAKSYQNKGVGGLIGGRSYGEEYYNISGEYNGVDNEAIYFLQNGYDLTDMHIVVQLEYKSLNQYKYLQYRLNFVSNIIGVVVTSEQNTYEINTNSNTVVDLTKIRIYEDGVQLDNSQLVLHFSHTTDYVDIVGTNLISYPYFTDRVAKLTVVVEDTFGEFKGQGYLTINIKGVTLEDNYVVNELTMSGVKYEVCPMIITDEYNTKYLGDYTASNVNSLDSAVYNLKGERLPLETYKDYLSYNETEKKFYLKNGKFIQEDVTIELENVVSLKYNGVVYDSITYKRTIIVPESMVKLIVTRRGTGYTKVTESVKSVFRYDVSAEDMESGINISIDFGNNVIGIPKVELLNSSFAGFVNVASNGVITFSELFVDSVVSIGVSTEIFNTVVDLHFGAFALAENYTEMQNLTIVSVGTKIDKGEDVVLVNNMGVVVNNDTEQAYSISGTKITINKANYILAVKSKLKVNGSPLVVDGKNVYVVTLYKTIDKPKEYKILLDGDDSASIDIFTVTGKVEPILFAKNYTASLIINGGQVSGATFEVVNIVGNEATIVNRYLRFTASGSNIKIEYIYELVKEAQVYFTLRTVHDEVEYLKEYVVNIHSPFVTGQTLSYTFKMSTDKDYVWQKIVELSDFEPQLEDLSCVVSAKITSGSENLKIVNNAIYAKVPYYSINATISRTGTMSSLTINAEQGYTGQIQLDYSFVSTTAGGGSRVYQSIGSTTLKLNIENGYNSSSIVSSANELTGVTNIRMSTGFSTYVSQPMFEVATKRDSSKTTLTYNYSVQGGSTGKIDLGTIQTRSAIIFEAVVPSIFNKYYTVEYVQGTDSTNASIKFKFNKNYINARTQVFLLFKATYDGGTTKWFYCKINLDTGTMPRDTMTNELCFEKNGRAVKGFTYLGEYSVGKEATNVQRGTILSAYNLNTTGGYSYAMTLGGVGISGSSISFKQSQNDGFTYLKISEQYDGTTTGVYILKIVRNDYIGAKYKFVIADDYVLYSQLKEFENSPEELDLIRNTLGLVSMLGMNQNIVVTKLDYHVGDFLLFSVQVVRETNNYFNAVSSFYLLEVRNTSYTYTQCYNITYNVLAREEIQNTVINAKNFIMNSEGEVVDGVEIQNYTNVVSYDSTSGMLTFKPVFKDVVVTATIRTIAGGIYRYYYVNFMLRAVSKDDARSVVENNIVVPTYLTRGNAFNFLNPTNLGSDYTFEWKVISDDTAIFDNSTNMLMTYDLNGLHPRTNLQTVVANLCVKSLYGEYVYSHYINITDITFHANYMQNVFNFYSGQTINLSSLGDWTYTYNGVDYNEDEIKEIFNDFSKSFTFVSGDTSLAVSGENIATALALKDRKAQIKYTVNVAGCSYSAMLYIEVQSGVQFVAGTHEIGRNSYFSLVSENATGTSGVDLFIYALQSVVKDGYDITSLGTIRLVEKNFGADTKTIGQVKTDTLAEGYNKVTIKVEDSLGNQKTVAFTLKVRPTIKQDFNYIEREYEAKVENKKLVIEEEKVNETLEIVSGGNYTFTKKKTSIGTFALAEIMIDGVEYSAKILNNYENFDFYINYNGSLLEIVNKTIYAGDVLERTSVSVQIVLTDGQDDYIGYVTVVIVPRYKFEKVYTGTMYEIDANSTISVADLVSVYKNGVLINSLDGENIALDYKFIVEDGYGSNILPTINENGTIYFGYDTANSMYKLRMTYSCGGEAKEIYYIISVNPITYNIDVKTDIYSLYSMQSIDLSKSKFIFCDSDGYLMDTSETAGVLTFSQKASEKAYYTLNGSVITAQKCFESVITSFVVSFTRDSDNAVFSADVALIINATYIVSAHDSMEVYAESSVSLDFDIWDTYRNVSAKNEFYTYIEYKGQVIDAGANFALGYADAGKSVKATLVVAEIGGKVRDRHDFTIKVKQSRFIKLRNDGVYINNNFISGGQNLLDLISVVNQNGEEIAVSVNEFSVELLVGSDSKFSCSTDLIYVYQTEIAENITIRIIDEKTSEYVDYSCYILP